ncbi:MAG: hypothetical protein AAB906_01020 [Patescibacteria group bacterium]
MNKIRKIIEDKKGTALFMTLMVLTGALTVALGAANLVTPGIIMSRTQTQSTKAFFTAESGAERALWLLRKNSFDNSNCDGGTNKYVRFEQNRCGPYNQSVYSLSNGSTYYIEYDSGTETTLNSNGSFQDTKRRVEIMF